MPILWLGGHGLIYLIVIQAISGIAWSGFNLSATNLLYESADPERRTRVIALFNALSGLALCGGALLGGLLAPVLPKIGGHAFLTLFLVSGILRGITVAVLLPKVAPSGQGAQVPNIPSRPGTAADCDQRRRWASYGLGSGCPACSRMPVRGTRFSAPQLEQKRPVEPYPPWPG